ncbi:hypothetical protein ACFY2K_16050 [Kitasatospora sp. NPDC001309]|uniref:hypothetical protein n=1 Tax=Kitasatospora sp. NPDC001309 TaxID=3364013 RepID=UPI003690F64E
MSDRVAIAGEVALDSSADILDRISALHFLADLDPESGLMVALAATENSDQLPGILTCLGKEVARISSSHRWLTEFEMRNMAGPAFDAYCDYLE